MHAITEEDRKALESAPCLMLAEWWCLLNKFEWPGEGMGEPDPIPAPWRVDTRRNAVMSWISSRIGLRECLREWNREAMPGELFDEWWDRRPKIVA